MGDRNPEANQSETQLADYRRLKEENAELRRLLIENGIAIPIQQHNASAPPMEPDIYGAGIDERSGKEAKIALFRDLFRGRQDVYALRKRFKSGEWGYVPASIRDWKSVLSADTALRKKIDQRTRKLLPLTDDVFRQHLEGKQTIGVYPLLPDETCWFLAVDFDKKSWQDDALAFLETCRALGIPTALERSRSGNGGHIWIFFERAIPASAARKLGSLVLTRTMDRRHQLGMDSYDRFFPNQDTMPKGGFGNLIALPLQWIPRKEDNSVFLDADVRPHPDQWKFLSSVQRMAPDCVEALVQEAMRTGSVIGVRISLADEDDEIEPWTMPPSGRRRPKPVEEPLPERVEIVRSNLLYLDKNNLPPAMLNRLLRLAAFQNPEFYKAQAMRLSTFGKPRIISCAQDFAQHVALPRGCLAEVTALLKDHKIKIDFRDERYAGTSIEANFQGRLRSYQEEAVAAIGNYDEGILCAPTAFGKTAVAAWLIAKRKVNTLVLVHRQQLLDQWHERLAMFLGLPANAIGQIGGGKSDRTGCIDVAVIQSLRRKEEVKDFVAEYGQVIVDECHHISAFTFEQVLRQAKARYIVGLTATPTRKDGHHPIIYMQCGPIRFNMGARTMTETTPFEHKVIPRHTDFRMPAEMADLTIQDVYAALVNDSARNVLIAADLRGVVEVGRSPLLLTGRKDHLEFFAAAVEGCAKHIFVLKGGMGKKQRRATAEALAAVPETESRVIIATGSYIGEGFDDARLDTLFLAMPISWKGTLQQYVGRLHRLHDSKLVVQVYDYVDRNVAMLARMYERRLKGYDAIGYTLERASVNLPTASSAQA
ncbi:MAG: TOTE conflict system archaeo-eukaryotic primase domain-containing protein [Bryobacteraceae bacterium]